MAGVKGKSGGARKGAGRKPDVASSADTSTLSPLEALLSIMNDPSVSVTQRISAAKAAAPYIHKKSSEPGKKSQKQEAAAAAGSGKYAPAEPPKLKIVYSRAANG